MSNRKPDELPPETSGNGSTPGGGAHLTQLLAAAGRGDEGARARLWRLVYDELRRLAAAQMAREAPGHTLQPTALVAEAYLRLAGSEGRSLTNRRQFFAAAANIMRQIRVDDARKRKRIKRGGGAKRVPLDGGIPADGSGRNSAAGTYGSRAVEEDPLHVLAVDEAIKRLEQFDPMMAEVVVLRYYGGLSIDEIADQMKIASRAVSEHWNFARAWLHREIVGD